MSVCQRRTVGWLCCKAGVTVAGVQAAGVTAAEFRSAGVTVAGVTVAGVPVAGAWLPELWSPEFQSPEVVAGVTVAGVPAAGVTLPELAVAGSSRRSYGCGVSGRRFQSPEHGRRSSAAGVRRSPELRDYLFHAESKLATDAFISLRLYCACNATSQIRQGLL